MTQHASPMRQDWAGRQAIEIRLPAIVGLDEPRGFMLTDLGRPVATCANYVDLGVAGIHKEPRRPFRPIERLSLQADRSCQS